MDKQDEQPMSWGKIIGILLLTGIVAGLLLGGLNSVFGLSHGMVTSGVGVCIGVVASLLISRRHALLNK